MRKRDRRPHGWQGGAGAPKGEGGVQEHGKGQLGPTAPPSPGPARARDASAEPELSNLDEILRVVGAASVEGRIEVIARLMASGAYEGYSTKVALAERWGLQFKTVENYACEASRLVRGTVDLAAETAELISDQKRIARKAEAVGEFKAASSALDAVAELIGAKKQRLELTGKGGLPLGLPPAFALLLESLDPPATPAELEHYALVGPEACAVPRCRLHPAAGVAGELTGGTET